MKKERINYIFVIALFLISLAHIVYFTNSNVSVTGDYLFHLSRIENIYKNFKIGTFLPVIDQSNMGGLGYLIDLYYPNLFYYLPAVLRFFMPVNIAFIVSATIYKIIFGLIYYKVIVRLTDNKKMAVSFSLVYISSYYVFVDLVSRQAISEFFASLILPLVVFGLYDLLKNKRWKLLFISMTLMVYTHLLTLVISSIFVAVFCIVNIRKILKEKEFLLGLIKATLFSFLAGSGFIIPFVYYIKQDKYCVNEIFKSLITVNNIDHIVNVLIFISVLIILLIFNKLFEKKLSKDTRILISGLFFSLYLNSPLCDWNVLTFFAIFQYKIRIGLLINLFVVGLLTKLIIKKRFYFRLCLLIGIVVYFEIICGSIMNKQTHEQYKMVYSIDDCHFNMDKCAEFKEEYCQIVFGEYIPVNFEINNISINELFNDSILDVSSYIVDNSPDLPNYIKEDKNKFIITTDKSELIIPKLYYPTYRIYQENNPDINIENYNGLIKINNISDGEIILDYGNTLLQYITFIISILTIIIVFNDKKILKRDL